MKFGNYNKNPENRPAGDKKKSEPRPRPPKDLSFADNLKWRLNQVKPTRWVRFAIVSILFFLLVIWIGNPWLLIFWLLLIDIYITAYIPWTWWKGTTGITRTLLGWMDAIIYALVLVYIIFAFIGQNYKIPSSSLEKSLLVGDFLWVNKTTYGPRVPNTPVHFPLAHNTWPIIGGKSYLDNPHFEYHRLPGLREVERGDIVVFNFPQGDTVFSKVPDLDYYEASYALRQQGQDPLTFFSANKDQYGEMIVRPVDRRENYVKRAIGLPGERIKISKDTVYINGKPIGFADKVQFNYVIPYADIEPERWLDAGIRLDDNRQGNLEYYIAALTDDQLRTLSSMVYNNPSVETDLYLMRVEDWDLYKSGLVNVAKPNDKQQNLYVIRVNQWKENGFNINPKTKMQQVFSTIGANTNNDDLNVKYFNYFNLPLSAEIKRVVESWPEVNILVLENDLPQSFYSDYNNVWPLGNSWDWSRSNTDEFWIPKRGKTLELTLNNLPLYRRAIETYEGNKVEVKDGKIYINGQDNPYYTFRMDYYWMMGDNRDRSKDSRYFGLVPEDHIVGTPARILISIDEEREWLDLNKIRWDRILANPNPDKDKAAEKNW